MRSLAEIESIRDRLEHIDGYVRSDVFVQCELCEDFQHIWRSDDSDDQFHCSICRVGMADLHALTHARAA